MWYNKKILSKMSIADLKAIRDYSLIKIDLGFDETKWSYIGRIVVEELEKRINECFQKP